MSADEPRRLIFVGVLPSGHDAVFADGPDPVAAMVREAGAALDRERAEAERQQKTAALDAERARRTKLARARKRLKRALSWL
jgi:hypothetical protein